MSAIDSILLIGLDGTRRSRFLPFLTAQKQEQMSRTYLAVPATDVTVKEIMHRVVLQYDAPRRFVDNVTD